MNRNVEQLEKVVCKFCEMSEEGPWESISSNWWESETGKDGHYFICNKCMLEGKNSMENVLYVVRNSITPRAFC